MNWKKLLLFDMRRLTPGGGEVPEGPPPEPFSWLRRNRAGKPFRPGYYYRTCTNMKWTGPLYINGSIWRRDLLNVMNQLTAMAKVNAPFHHGLDALARDQYQSTLPFSGVRAARLSVALLISCAFLAIFLILGSAADVFDEGDLMAGVFLLASCVGALLPALLVINRGGAREALLLRMRDHMESGRTLSETMRRFPRFFPRFYADLVEAGETSGQLAATLEGITGDTLRRVTLRRALKPIGWYLFIVFSIQVTLMSFIIAKVVPVFVELFRELPYNISLTWPLRAALSISHAVSGGSRMGTPTTLICLAAGFCLVVGVVLPMALRVRRRNGLATCGISFLALPIPGLRRIMIQQNLVAASVILEKLLSAGMPLDEALERVGNADIHRAYRNLFLRARLRVLQGETLSNALRQSAGVGLLPRLYLGLVALGERAGMLPQALERVSELYQSNVEKRIRILYDSLLPVGVVLLGCVSLFGELLIIMSLTSLVDALMLV